MNRPLIIHRPDLQHKRQRWMFSAITLMAWLLWIYLILPLVTLLAWALGILVFRVQILSPFAGQDFIKFSGDMLQVIMALGFMFFAWSRYNFYKFSRYQRRHPIPNVNTEEIAHYFRLSPPVVEWARTMRQMTVDVDLGNNSIQFIKPPIPDTIAVAPVPVPEVSAEIPDEIPPDVYPESSLGKL